jgi:uncharacterized protein DUF6371/zinc ribbon protein
LNSELNEVNAMYKYSLHNKSNKHFCPKCLKKRFVLYVDNDTGKTLSEKVGRCDREINCGYHYTPKMYFQDNNMDFVPFALNKASGKKDKPTSFHSIVDVNSSLNTSLNNNFLTFLNSIFEFEKVESIIKLYRIGTASFWNNATIFWQIDIENKVRGGKMIMYKKTGKRTRYINWVHSYKIKHNQISEFNLNQCFFGEHLLNQFPEKTIALVESEKTACIMSQIFEKYIWMATGSLSGLSIKKLKILKDKKIILYPDLGLSENKISPYSFWKERCQEFIQQGYDVSISDLLEKNGTENQKKLGYDIADYFIELLTNQH